MPFNSKTAVRFSGSLEPGEKETLSKPIETDATIEHLTVRFYPGQELNLSVFPFRQRDSDMTPLVELRGREDIVGDDDVFEFDISEDLQADDEIVIEVENQNDTYIYDFIVHVEIDRLGGSSRLMSWLGGVL